MRCSFWHSAYDVRASTCCIIVIRIIIEPVHQLNHHLRRRWTVLKRSSRLGRLSGDFVMHYRANIRHRQKLSLEAASWLVREQASICELILPSTEPTLPYLRIVSWLGQHCCAMCGQHFHHILVEESSIVCFPLFDRLPTQ